MTGEIKLNSLNILHISDAHIQLDAKEEVSEIVVKMINDALKVQKEQDIKINRHSPYLSITLHKRYPYYLFGISTFPNSAYHSIALRKFSITIV